MGTGLLVGSVVSSPDGEARADETAAAIAVAAATPNHPPAFASADGEGSSLSERRIGVRAGKTLRYPLSAIDPDGDAITYRIEPLPPFARFDPREGVLEFAPTTKNLGSHRFLVDASDGRSVTRLNLVVHVSVNRPPDGTVDRVLLRGAQASRSEPIQIARDDNGDALTAVSRRIPPRARLVQRESALLLEFEPTEADVGEHAIDLEVTDGDDVSRVRTTLIVVPEWSLHGWSSAFLPVPGAAAFLTQEGESYAGPGFEVTWWVRRRSAYDGIRCARFDDHGGECFAGQFRMFGSAEILAETASKAPRLFTYSLGYEGAFESFPNRRYAIPFYGFEGGGLYQSERGHRAQARVSLGLWLLSHERAWLSAALGYRAVPAEVSTLSGATFAVRAQINPW